MHDGVSCRYHHMEAKKCCSTISEWVQLVFVRCQIVSAHAVFVFDIKLGREKSTICSKGSVLCEYLGIWK